MSDTEKLPDKLSALLRLAVHDAQLCEAQPELYVLDMCSWHELRGDLRCHVCLAGAVMAQTLGAPVAENEDARFGGI